MVPTERTDISEYGPLNEVAYTLADKVLTGPNQEVKLLATSEVHACGAGWVVCNGGAWVRSRGE